MLNKIFLEGIIARKPTLQKTIKGENYCLLIVICKVESPKVNDNNIPVVVYPDDIIPVIAFGKTAEYLCNNREAGDVVSVEGMLKTPNRKVVVQCQKIKLIKSAEFKKYEREVILEAERRKYINEHSND